eukprot:m.23032 g.23032  ORF g.23032 m.23032 type:complete len:555 (+) comp7459_c0_seq1:200-1864(+)
MEAEKTEKTEKEGEGENKALKTTLSKCVTKLSKTLQEPAQASLELIDGWLRLDALSGPLRPEKLKNSLSCSDSVHPYDRLRKLVVKSYPLFEWSVDRGADTAVRLLGYGAKLASLSRMESSQIPQYMFPDGPHSLRALDSMPLDEVRELLIANQLEEGVPIVLLEPNGVVDYRGCANEPVWDFLQSAQQSGLQVIVMSWAGNEGSANSRLDRLQSRMEFLLDRLDLEIVPVFACSGNRLGLLALAELMGKALNCQCAVLNRGRDLLFQSFATQSREALKDEAPNLFQDSTKFLTKAQLWIYASASTRSTSSTGSTASLDLSAEDGADEVTAAAMATAKMWTSVLNDSACKEQRTEIQENSAVVLDSESLCALPQVVECGAKVTNLQNLANRLNASPRAPEVMEPLSNDTVKQVLDVIKNKENIDDEVRKKILSFGGSSKDSALALCTEAIVHASADSDGDIMEEIKKYNTSMLLDLVDFEREKGQRKLLIRLGGLADIQQKVMGKLLQICKHLYDENVVEEDTFLKWTPSDNVSSKVEPFITWLKEAEEEEDDE